MSDSLNPCPKIAPYFWTRFVFCVLFHGPRLDPVRVNFVGIDEVFFAAVVGLKGHYSMLYGLFFSFFVLSDIDTSACLFL